MSKVSIGKKIPAFSAAATGDKTIKLADLKGTHHTGDQYDRHRPPARAFDGRANRQNGVPEAP